MSHQFYKRNKKTHKIKILKCFHNCNIGVRSALIRLVKKLGLIFFQDILQKLSPNLGGTPGTPSIWVHTYVPYFKDVKKNV